MKKNLTTILFALVAMMMPIGAWATVYETPDFSDAKVLTTVDGSLYVDGVELEITPASLGSSLHQTIPVGKYILNSNIESIYWIGVNEGEVMINLNGYTWNLNDRDIRVTSTLSIYDTSANETGKICSYRNVIHLDNPKDECLFNLYSGTLESRGATNWTLDASWGSAYLYGGTIKGNGPGVYYYLSQPTVIKLMGTVIDNAAGQPHCIGSLAVDMPAAAIVDVSEYEGDSLNVYIDVVNTPGKMTIIRGIQDEEAAARYTIEAVCESYYDLFCEKEEYDPTTGEKSIYIATNQFTQQPTLENGGTVVFNNPAATLQWYEVEQTILTDTNTTPPSENVYVDGYWKAQRGASLFEYRVTAGDILLVTTTQDIERVMIDTGEDLIELTQDKKSSIMSFENDSYIRVWVPIITPDTITVDLQFSIIKETLLPDETGNRLQQATHGKTYYCKATVGERSYVSDVYQYQREVLWGTSADALTEGGTLAEAITAVRTDGAAYVQLQRDIVGASYMQVLRNDVTLDLNGYTVIAAEAYLFDILNVEGDVHMTVIDSSPAQSGEIIANKEDAGGAIFCVYGGHLTIENGSFVGNDNMAIIFNQSDGTVAINGGYLQTRENYTIDNKGTLQISGGVFESSNQQVLQLYDGSATISGGSFITSDDYESFRYYQGVLDLAAYPTEVEEGTTPLNELSFTYWGETMSLSELDIRLPEGYYVLCNNQVVDTLNSIDIYYFGTGVTTDVEHTSTASPTTDSQKILRNGQIYIYQNGEIYTIMGQKVPELK